MLTFVGNDSFMHTKVDDDWQSRASSTHIFFSKPNEVVYCRRSGTLLLSPVGNRNARLEKCNRRDCHIRVPVSTAEQRGSRETRREVLRSLLPVGDAQELNK
jgi:hypothetical protein